MMDLMTEGESRYVNCSIVNEKTASEFCLDTTTTQPFASFQNFENYRSSNAFCDISIKIGDEVFRAHKVVLASVSPYFHAMFTSPMRETNSDTVELHDLDPHSVKLLLDYIYTSTIHIVEENVQKLLSASNMLQLEKVRNACCLFLETQLDPCNALGILMFADAHGCDNLVKTAESYVLKNFVQISTTEEFYLLGIERMKFFLSSNRLQVNEEEQAYNAVINWIKYDIDSRKNFVSDLLDFVRLPLLKREFLTVTVYSEKMIKQSNSCKDLLLEAMRYHLSPEMRRYMQSSRTKARVCDDNKPMLYVLGGQNLFGTQNDCEVYIPVSQSWLVINPMLANRARLGVGIIHNNLYAVGGFDGTVDLSSVEVMNFRTNTWSGASNIDMGTSRSCLAVAVLHNLLYAIGGYDGTSCLNSVERYDPLSQLWTSVAKMEVRRRYLAVGVIDEHIIAAGGYDGSHHLSSCEVYDPVNNHWVQYADMHSQRSSAAGCVLNGFFYVSGGSDGSLILQTVERFDIVNGVWTFVAPMINPRMTHSLVVVQDRLLALGGNDGSISLSSTEEYIPDTDEWISQRPMCTRRSHVAAAWTS